MKKFSLTIIVAVLVLSLSLIGCSNDPDEPYRIQNFTATKRTSDSITLSWSRNPKADFYYVYQYTESNNFPKEIKVNQSSSPSYTDTGLSASKTYRYRIGLNNSGVEYTLWDQDVIEVTTLPSGTSNPGGGTPGTGGTITITGIPSTYNGKYAYFSAYYSVVVYSDTVIAGFQGYNSTTKVLTLCQITNGSVSLPAWTGKYTNGIIDVEPVRYSGNDTAGPCTLFIHSSSPIITSAETLIDHRVFGINSFSNGSITLAWGNGWNLGEL